tara:strand:+ start:310 stop:1125 length:816 start_codon:yes stop_codon:yes gene_type:complete
MKTPLNNTPFLKTTLTRIVRLALNKNRTSPESFNSFASNPSPSGLWIPVTIAVTGQGSPNSMTGYLFDIHKVDRLIRSKITCFLHNEFFNSKINNPPTVLIKKIADLIRDDFPTTLYSVKWMLSSYHQITILEIPMPKIILSETFEFAAAHRLNCDKLTEEENKKIFGKCNNPEGHGHNYRLNIDVESSLESPLTHLKIEEIVHKHVIKDYDHHNLDQSVPEFANKTSSVEHIASECFKRLENPVLNAGGQLKRVEIWETSKTGCAIEAVP